MERSGVGRWMVKGRRTRNHITLDEKPRGTHVRAQEEVGAQREEREWLAS